MKKEVKQPEMGQEINMELDQLMESLEENKVEMKKKINLKAEHFQKKTIEDEMQSILKDMSTMDVTSEEYKKAAMNLELLAKAKSYDYKNVLNKDTIFKGVMSLVTVGMVLKHEEFNVIATKALQFIPKIF